MIYDYFDVTPLKPVRYQIAQICVLSKAYKRPKIYRRQTGITVKGGGIFNMLITCCTIAFLLLAIFTAVNIIGFGDFMDNLKQVIEYQNLDNFFTNPEFV